MFFRREKPRTLSFEDRLNAARAAGFTSTSAGAGAAQISRNGCAAVVEPGADGNLTIGRAGIQVKDGIAYLVDGGYQKFFQLPDGRKMPALATHLKALHTFNEDLREALGLTSLYNQSLGSTSATHMYDRVKGRDAGAHDQPWEHKGESH